MKTRSDAWYAMLTEEQLWKLYAIAKRCQWEGFSAAASAELGVEVFAQAGEVGILAEKAGEAAAPGPVL